MSSSPDFDNSCLDPSNRGVVRGMERRVGDRSHRTYQRQQRGQPRQAPANPSPRGHRHRCRTSLTAGEATASLAGIPTWQVGIKHNAEATRGGRRVSQATFTKGELSPSLRSTAPPTTGHWRCAAFRSPATPPLRAATRCAASAVEQPCAVTLPMDRRKERRGWSS